ncbi:hypothetical protein [Paraburkholderia sp.]|uniref:hypothetical protein n=1 Tax=Paraburkholderia sp. TaxID=1926495 RepID=UPI00286F230E|nr:hypothetical protein [Paraburkholderia sp.]
MGAFTIFAIAVITWVAVWRLTARHWRRKGKGAITSHVSGACAGLAAGVFALVLGIATIPFDSTTASSEPSSTGAASQATAAVTPASSPEALAPGVHVVVGGKWLSCQSQEQLSKIHRYSIDGDDAAYRKAALEALGAGECTILKTGDKVALVDTAILHGLVKLRRFGETDEYWTNMESISEKTATEKS